MKVGKIKKGHAFAGTIVRVVSETDTSYTVTFARYSRGMTKDYTIEYPKEAIE